MNNFELFSLIFFMLNACWENCKDTELGQFLSGMNPYLWESEMSADPAWYEEFKEFRASNKELRGAQEQGVSIIDGQFLLPFNDLCFRHPAHG